MRRQARLPDGRFLPGATRNLRPSRFRFPWGRGAVFSGDNPMLQQQSKSAPRDPTYGDEAAVRALNSAADALRCVIIRSVAAREKREEAIALVNQSTVVVFAAIKAA